ncbi:MAG TPA: putative lipid II flippase FtsW [Mycobacteriales bacterium]|nr:putative lipid II flippase FtsW [Mycobacteriales bacterium]
MTTYGDAMARASTKARTPLLARPLTSYYLLVGSALLLLGLGLVMVLSASSVDSFSASGSSLVIFRRQLLWVLIGLPMFWVASRLPVRAFRLLAYPLLLGSIVGLLLVFVPGIGAPPVSGARRWIEIGPIRFQPSEVAKYALVLWGADLYARKQALLNDWKHLLVPLVPVAALLALLIMIEPDMGTTMTLVAVVVALLWVVGAPLRIFSAFFAVLVSLSAVLAVVEPYRLRRVTSFVDPCATEIRLTDGFQGCQGLYAIASGGWFGVGLGGSRQKWSYLPNAHTDYIFAIVGEELGLLGTLLVLILFAVLAYAGVRIAQRAQDTFVRLAAAGVTAWVIAQALINMGAVTGLLPITGIPLPFISFGGSSLGVTLFAVGMLAAFARREPGVSVALAARGPRLPARTRRAVAAFYGFGPGPRPRGRAASSARSARPARAARTSPQATSRR